MPNSAYNHYWLRLYRMDVVNKASVTLRHLNNMVLNKKNVQCLQIMWNQIRVNFTRLRLVNCYYIAFGVSVALIFAGIRYAGYIKTDGEEGPMVPIRTNSYDGSRTIESIMEETKTKVKSDFLNYNFSHSGVNDSEDLLMDSGGSPVRSLIVSTWRSGSTFLGQVINAIPSTFYHYEPLAYYGVRMIRNSSQAIAALRSIKHIFQCKFDGMEDFFKYGKHYFYLFNQNPDLWKYCKYNIDLCLDANFMSKFCRLFPIQNMKLLRVRLRFIQEILVDKELNVKVVMMVRDPRAVMQSRMSRHFCKLSSDCRQLELLCADMVSDYFAAIRLLPTYPDRLMVLRYEDLALKPKITTTRILKFLKLSATSSVKEYLEWHTTIEGIGVDTTYRKSQDMAFKWKTSIDYDYVDRIQRVCKEAMDLWGYRAAHNATHMASKDFNPLTRCCSDLSNFVRST